MKVVSDDKYKSVALHEFNMTKSLVHPNIISSRNWFDGSLPSCNMSHVDSSFAGDHGEIALVQDYAPHGDLYDWLDAGITEQDMRRVLGDIVRLCCRILFLAHPW